MSTSTVITAEFVKNLRKAAKSNDYADRYWIRVEALRSPNWTGTVLTLSREHTNGDTASEYHTTFYDIVGCGKGGGTVPVEHHGAIGQVVTARYCAVQTFYRTQQGLLPSLANTLKVGDEVRARFVLNNSTENLKKAGLEHDSAYLQVIRGGKFVCEFFVDDVIAPTGSSALLSYQYTRDIPGHIANLVAKFEVAA